MHKVTVLLMGKAPKKVSGLPFVYQDLGVLGFVANLLGKSTVVLMGVGQNDPSDIRKLDAVLCKLFAKALDAAGVLGPTSISVTGSSLIR